jgi:alanine dehydrogenase
VTYQAVAEAHAVDYSDTRTQLEQQ